MRRKKSNKWIWTGVLLFSLLTIVSGLISGPDDHAENPGGAVATTASTTSAPMTPSAPPTTAPPLTTTDPPTVPPGPTDDPVSQLTISGESHGETYERTLFPHWLDLDGDGCDTRCEVLAAEKLAGGGWMSTYDGLLVQDRADLDIDHLVPLAEAWRSGAWAWDTPKRASFANDLDEPASLAAVTAQSNRSKRDGDPAIWRPQVSEWCTYARSWIRVKLRWQLSADPAEAQALREMLRTC